MSELEENYKQSYQHIILYADEKCYWIFSSNHLTFIFKPWRFKNVLTLFILSKKKSPWWFSSLCWLDWLGGLAKWKVKKNYIDVSLWLLTLLTCKAWGKLIWCFKHLCKYVRLSQAFPKKNHQSCFPLFDDAVDLPGHFQGLLNGVCAKYCWLDDLQVLAALAENEIWP